MRNALTSVCLSFVCALVLGCVAAPVAWTQEKPPVPPRAKKRITLEIRDPNPLGRSWRTARDRRPLVFFGDYRFNDFAELRRWLREWADPVRFRDVAAGPVSGTSDLWFSSREVRIVCDGTLSVSWAQAVVLLCDRVKEDTDAEYREKSPRVRRFELGLRGTDRRVPLRAPVHRLLIPGRPVRTGKSTVRVHVPRTDWLQPVTARGASFLLAGRRVGQSRGVAVHSRRPGHFSLLVSPPETLLTLRRLLRETLSTGETKSAAVSASAQAPFVCVFEAAEAAADAGFVRVGLRDVPVSVLDDLASVGVARGAGEAAPRKLAPSKPLGPLPASTAVFPGRRRTKRNLRALGGGGRTHQTVELGLDWLARHQGPDGSWNGTGFAAECSHGGSACGGAATDGANDVGLTGLAVCAFLAHGHTPRDGPYRMAIRRALAWLKLQQDQSGRFGPKTSPQAMYCHATAALAMTEAYAMTRVAQWKESAQRSIDFILRAQNPYKAWRYGVRSGDNDTSMTSWMILALNSARAAGLVVHERAFQWAHGFIEEMTDPKTGRTGYTKRGEPPVRVSGAMKAFPPDRSESLTAAGIFTRVLCGEDPRSSPVINKGANLLKARLPVWDPAAGDVDMYYWYQGTLAMFQIGGRPWAWWNARMKNALVPNQVTVGCARGSWDPLGPWGKSAGRIYATALMTLTLEVYYRYPRAFDK